MFIPYADPRPFLGWRHAFDIGEYGIGIMANSLERGCDCLGEIRYFDAELADSSGEPYLIRKAICLHEEDFGLLWKHFDADLQTTETRRSRRLVVSFIITASNYEYANYWYFYQDGAIEFEVKLTGIVLTSAIAPGDSSTSAPWSHRRRSPPITSTSSASAWTWLSTGCATPCTGGHRAVPPGPWHFPTTVRRRTATAPGIGGPARHRPPAGRALAGCQSGQRTELGHEPGYKLIPGSNILSFSHPDSPVTQRAAFATRHLWVTPYRPDELFPAGDYPNQHPGGAGLPAWTKADRPIENADVVLWYTLGSHHITRPEDWPVTRSEPSGPDSRAEAGRVLRPKPRTRRSAEPVPALLSAWSGLVRGQADEASR